MLYVVYKNSGCHSGRALRAALTSIYKKPVLGGYPRKMAIDLAKKKVKPEHVINLGVTDPFPLDGRILNTQDMVRASSNKRKARELFSQKEVPAPVLFLSGDKVTKADLPVVGRTSYHSKGRGFWFCKTVEEVRAAVKAGATHFLQFVPNAREYRVHTFIKPKCWLGKDPRSAENYASIKISEKVWVGEGRPDPNEPQKNHHFGWSFLAPQDRREDEIDVVRYAAKQAIAALGLDFGAVDVMFQLRTKRPFVLEVNSTPSLSDANADTCEVYARRILKTIGALPETE